MRGRPRASPPSAPRCCPGRRTAGRARSRQSPRPVPPPTASATSSGSVPPAQPPELARIHRLRPERDPRDAGITPRCRVAALIGTGIGLERHLGPGGQPEPRPDPLEEPRDGVRWEQGRRATAEVDGFERLQRPGNAGSAGRAEVQLGLEGGQERGNSVARARGPRPRRRRRNRSTGRARHAERDVDVQRDRRQGRRCRHRSGGAGSREPTIRQPRGGRRRASISSTSRPRGSG